MSNTPIAVLVTFSIITGREPQFLEILIPHLRRVSAEQTCRTLRLNRDESDASRYMLYEEWEDRDEFLEVQLKRDYRIPCNAALEKLEAVERGVSLWEKIPL